MWVDDLCLLGIFCLWLIIVMINFYYVGFWKDYLNFLVKDKICWIW